AGRNLKQAVRRFGALKLFGSANNLAQFLDCRVLLVNRKLRITDNVDEKDMSNLKLDLFPDLSGHFYALSGRPKLFFSTVLYLRFRSANGELVRIVEIAPSHGTTARISR